MAETTFKCPVCKSLKNKLWGIEYEGFRILRCQGCSLRFLDPSQRPGATRYDDRYFDHKSTRLHDPDKLLHILRSDARSLGAILDHRDRPLAPNASILDIGAGIGSFLVLCKLAGYPDISGTDVTDSNVEFLRSFGIELKVGDITQVDVGTKDIVTFHHVLEHIPDPTTFLEKLRQIMKSDSTAHLIVPNEGSLNSRFKSLVSRLRLKRKRFKHLSPGHHLWFFERRTLERLLTRHGFRIDYIGTRAAEKHRGALNSLYHKLLDFLLLNTWLEAVIGKAGL